VTVIVQNICIIVQFHHAFSSLALPCSLARQFDQFRPDLMRALACSAVTTLYARAAVQAGFNLFLVQFHQAFIICMRALLFSRQVQTCSVVLL
jgi:hypothetical protein